MIKRQLTMDASRNVLLSDLPYRAGEKLTVIVIAENELQQRQQKWQNFFKLDERGSVGRDRPIPALY